MISANLVLQDGSSFAGFAIGGYEDHPIVTGEAVFNTVMTGYQEVITDPSYAGQIITFTYPHIGNYGVNVQDNEHVIPHCRGIITRDIARRPSNWRSEQSLDDFLRAHGIAGMTGVDTRKLTKHLRNHGALSCAFGTAPLEQLAEAAVQGNTTDGKDLVAHVTTREPYFISAEDTPRFRVVAYDFGIKRTILHHMRKFADIEVVPGSTSASDVLARNPDGVFLSNGPGDPAAVTYAIDAITQLLGEVPIFGICLGHQLLATALGGATHKLPFGHHGGNHPVKRLETGQVEITSQNHNYAVQEGSLRNAHITHVNLNDGVIEGIAAPELRAFGVQYHPEAGPGPHDARYLFDDFISLMESSR